MAKKSKKTPKVGGLLGLGLDNEDGHTRVTRGEGFVLAGGSNDTHEKMQDVAIRVTEALKDKGRRIQDASPAEVMDLVMKAVDRQG